MMITVENRLFWSREQTVLSRKTNYFALFILRDTKLKAKPLICKHHLSMYGAFFLFSADMPIIECW